MTAEQTNEKDNLEVDSKLLEILVCPVSHGQLRYERDAQELISDEAGRAYPVRNGIPIMLADEAREIRTKD